VPGKASAAQGFSGVGRVRDRSDLLADYQRALLASVMGRRLEGCKIVLDLCWGSAAACGEAVFQALGADLTVLHGTADGERINVDCGSTHLDHLRQAVLDQGASMGFAFDGDADRMLAVDGKGRVVASPRIVTADQVKAIIEQGTELPYQQAAGSGATSLTFRKANLKLEVTPQIAPDGRIILNVDINKDSVGRSTPNGFAIDTKHVQTQVRVDDGGTVMIGGIFETTEREDEARVPLLGSLPGLGALFRSRTRSLAKSELLVFLTPQVLVEEPRAAAP
jgi:type II secretory pathway component GspD/PulD (secretin)